MATAEPAPAGSLPPLGATLAGKYELRRLIGQGGMGVVYAAHHVILRQEVALKLLFPELATNNPGIVERFLNEARSAARIQNEHVARVLDIDRLDNGWPYLVMELLDGLDYAARIKQRGALSELEAVDVVLQACVALAEAHAMGIVHRDVKPSNLFLAQRADGTTIVKVLDFGIAKALSDESGEPTEGSLTGERAMLGSPLYTAPEQLLAAKDVDTRADIWSLGACLYHMLAGVPPFRGGTLAEICAKVVTGYPTPLIDAAPSASDGVREIVARCLQKEPKGRFQNVLALAEALLPFGPREADAWVVQVGRIHRAKEERVTRQKDFRVTRGVLVPRDPQAATPPDLGSISSLGNKSAPGVSRVPSQAGIDVPIPVVTDEAPPGATTEVVDSSGNAAPPSVTEGPMELESASDAAKEPVERSRGDSHADVPSGPLPIRPSARPESLPDKTPRPVALTPVDVRPRASARPPALVTPASTVRPPAITPAGTTSGTLPASMAPQPRRKARAKRVGISGSDDSDIHDSRSLQSSSGPAEEGGEDRPRRTTGARKRVKRGQGPAIAMATAAVILAIGLILYWLRIYHHR